VFNSQDEIAADGNIRVVDIAVFPWIQHQVAIPLLDAGKHLLCQKPLSYDLNEAGHIVEHAESCNRLLAVNQQLRFSESVAATHAMIEQGWIGAPFEMSWDFHVYTPWEAWPWVAGQPRLDLQQFTIHPLDAVRFILGDPKFVYGTQAREPGQPEKGETRTVSVLEFEGETRAFLRSFHKNRTHDPRAEFRVDGTEGSIRGTIGLMYDYPRGRADTLELNSRVLPTDGWLPYPVTSRWIPTAFIGPMASLLSAIATDGTPLTNGRDNLKTLRIVHALYESGHDHKVIRL
jgi:predicted dehydrogenase